MKLSVPARIWERSEGHVTPSATVRSGNGMTNKNRPARPTANAVIATARGRFRCKRGLDDRNEKPFPMGTINWLVAAHIKRSTPMMKKRDPSDMMIAREMNRREKNAASPKKTNHARARRSVAGKRASRDPKADRSTR